MNRGCATASSPTSRSRYRLASCRVRYRTPQRKKTRSRALPRLSVRDSTIPIRKVRTPRRARSFSFTEERAGLLVNKAQGNVGFLHLSLQEYLAARHVMHRPPAERIAFVSANAGRVRWREPILYLLFMIENETELGRLLEAIEMAPVMDADARAVRDALLTDAVFADLTMTLEPCAGLPPGCLPMTELTAWGARRTHLLGAAVDGLFSQSVGEMCRAKLAEWVPDRHGYGRAGAIQSMPTWSAALKPACATALLRCLCCENEYVWRIAARSLADRQRQKLGD